MGSYGQQSKYLYGVLALLVGLMNYQTALADTPSLLKDLNTSLDRVDNDNANTLDSKLIMFMDEHGGKGKEYFVSDGSVQGTHALSDIVAGSAGILGQGNNYTASNDFTVNLSGRRLDIISSTNSYSQYEMWSTNGTDLTTSKLVDFEDTSRTPEFLGSFGAMQFISVPTAISGVYSTKIWKTDGTTVGTVAIKELCAESDCSVFPVGSIGSSYLFVVSSTAAGLRLWKTDGTTVGTVAVKNLGAIASQSFNSAVVSGSKAFIVVRDSVAEYSRVWSSDGTSAGTAQITNITYVSNGTTYRPDEWGGVLQFTTGTDGEVYFKAIFNDYSTTQIFRSQGTNGTTVNISPAGSQYNDNGVYFGGALYFSGDTGNGIELLKYTSVGGTVLLKDLFPGQSVDEGETYENSGYPSKFIVSGSHFAFTAYSNNGESLWKSDGTTGGTVELKTFGDQNETGYLADRLIGSATGVYLVVDQNVANRGMWHSDLTSGGTQKVLSLNDTENVTVLATPTIAYFLVNEGAESGIYSSDGTANGTFKLKSFQLPNTESSYVSFSPKIRNKILLSSYNISSPSNVVVTDGLTSNTRELHNSEGQNLIDTNDIARITLNNLEYAAFIDSNKIYVSDLTDAGTRVVLTPEETEMGSFRDLAVIPNSKKGIILALHYGDSNNTYKLLGYSFENDSYSVISTFSETGLNPGGLSLEWKMVGSDGVYFLLGDFYSSDTELWYSDGTAANTRRLLTDADFGSNYISNARIVGNRLFFRGSTMGAGSELWTSDGTVAGSKMVVDLYPGSSSSYPSSFFEYNNQFYFSANSGTSSGYWRSDGTSAGTALAVSSGILKSVSESLYPIGTPAINDGTIYFICQRILCPSSCTSSFGLCRSLGSDATTNFITEIPRASVNSSIQMVKPDHSNDLYIAVQNSPSYTDGYIGKLSGSTFTPLNDLVPESNGVGANITNFIAVGGNLIFRASTTPYGDEPWSIVRDECTDDSSKTAPGSCGCGLPDVDSDGDSILDCSDNCAFDAAKTIAGACGCGIPDVDANGNGIADCLDVTQPPAITPIPTPVPTIAPPSIPPLTAPSVKANKKQPGTYTITALLVPGSSYVFTAEIQTGVGKKIKWKRAINKTIATNVFSAKLKKGKYRISYSIGGTVSPFKNFTAK